MNAKCREAAAGLRALADRLERSSIIPHEFGTVSVAVNCDGPDDVRRAAVAFGETIDERMASVIQTSVRTLPPKQMHTVFVRSIPGLDITVFDGVPASVIVDDFGVEQTCFPVRSRPEPAPWVEPAGRALVTS